VRRFPALGKGRRTRNPNEKSLDGKSKIKNIGKIDHHEGNSAGER